MSTGMLSHAIAAWEGWRRPEQGLRQRIPQVKKEAAAFVADARGFVVGTPGKEATVLARRAFALARTYDGLQKLSIVLRFLHQPIKQPLLSRIVGRGFLGVPLHRDELRIVRQLHTFDDAIVGPGNGGETPTELIDRLVVE